MDDLKLYEEIVRLKKEGAPAVLATVIEARGTAPRKAGAKMLIYPGDKIFGTVGGGVTEAEVIAAAQEIMGTIRPRSLSFRLTEKNGSVCGGDVTIYLEPINSLPRLAIIGSGHVAKALAATAAQAGFLPIPLTRLDRLGESIGRLSLDPGSFIFIATSEHQQDFEAAEAALATPAGYIAVLGSRRKKKAMDLYLDNQGFTTADISRIISPAGLEIGAETPEEIAVSVMAQIIQIRRTCHGTDRRDSTRL